MISREDVLHVALLSRLELNEEEVEKFATDLSAILEHVEQLRVADVEGVAPTSHPLALENVLREDEPRPCLPRAAVLANAPDRVEEGFRVPPVLEQH